MSSDRKRTHPASPSAGTPSAPVAKRQKIDLADDVVKAKETLKQAEEAKRIADEANIKNATTKLIQTHLAPRTVETIEYKTRKTIDYYAHSPLDFGRSWPSTMMFRWTLDDGTVLSFGHGAVRDSGTGGPCFHLELPDGPKGFLGKHRILPRGRHNFWWEGQYTVQWSADDHEALRANVALWTAAALHWKTDVPAMTKTIQALYTALHIYWNPYCRPDPDDLVAITPPKEEVVQTSRWS